MAVVVEEVVVVEAATSAVRTETTEPISNSLETRTFSVELARFIGEFGGLRCMCCGRQHPSYELRRTSRWHLTIQTSTVPLALARNDSSSESGVAATPVNRNRLATDIGECAGLPMWQIR